MRVFIVSGVQVLDHGAKGFAIVALGQVSTTGWTASRLEPFFYLTPPKDGILDLDFSASPPTGLAGDVITPISASIVIGKSIGDFWGKGVALSGLKVHATSNVFDLPIEPSDGSGSYPAMGTANLVQPFSSEPVPWPFPWSQQNKIGGGELHTWTWSIFGGDLPFPFHVGAGGGHVKSIPDVSGMSLRVFRTGDPITLDLRPDRCNVELNPQSLRIVSIWIG